MTRVLAFLAIAVLAACDGSEGNTLPDGVTGADVALFKVAVADQGCEISTPAQTGAIAAQTGFERDKLRAIIQYLTLAGDSEPLSVGFRLTSGQCANA